MNITFPYQFDTRGRTAESDEDRHIRELIEQLLFCNPGERVNRPTFGSGILQLVFAPNSPELASATQHMLQGALQQWLGELIRVEALDVRCDDAALHVTIVYIARRAQERRTVEFSRPLA
jgi:uncharacterized protein